MMGEQGERALSLLDQAVQLEPDGFAVLAGRMMVSDELGRYDQSVADADAIIALCPEAAEIHAHRAAARVRRGDPLDAILADLDRAIEAEPS